MYKRILLPTDGSPVAGHAVPAAIELARACGAEILTLSVAVPETVLPSIEGAMLVDPGPQADVLLDHARTMVEAVAAQVRAAGIACTALAKLSYYPAETIVDTAREQACDLIFMASHGRRGVSLLLAGSVTQAVLASAPVPVMVLRPPRATTPAEALARSCPAEAAS
ncbi:universal stress protein [Massilia sp. 9I]|uniref:universal stress protein n=1 Tax=Massilia sp. 9I TaxID=2653152 RepID=UPI0012EFC6E3|nr:universal stress protein [Massilia sp. 9I]VXB98933.1 Nucleotide-binding universal stress protein, UspA family [Massilia sp. 9I]